MGTVSPEIPTSVFVISLQRGAKELRRAGSSFGSASVLVQPCEILLQNHEPGADAARTDLRLPHLQRIRLFLQQPGTDAQVRGKAGVSKLGEGSGWRELL